MNELKDFRPINLIRSIYKVIAKLLPGKTKTSNSKLMDMNGMMFINDRQIKDVLLMVGESLDLEEDKKERGFKVRKIESL